MPDHKSSVARVKNYSLTRGNSQLFLNIRFLQCKGFTNLPHLETDELFQGQLCGPIASTMDEHMFRMVVLRWQEFSESAKEKNDWIPLSVTGTLFKEMVWPNFCILFSITEASLFEAAKVDSSYIEALFRCLCF